MMNSRAVSNILNNMENGGDMGDTVSLILTITPRGFSFYRYFQTSPHSRKKDSRFTDLCSLIRSENLLNFSAFRESFYFDTCNGWGAGREDCYRRARNHKYTQP